jgi:hypothetical protein
LKKVTLMLNFTNMQKAHLMRDYWFLNNIHIMGKMPEEWKNCIVIPKYKKNDKQIVENYRENSLFNACYKL